MFFNTTGYIKLEGHINLGEFTFKRQKKLKEMAESFEQGLEEHCENMIRIFSHKGMANTVKRHIFFYL